MVYKVVFDNGKKAIVIVADGKGEARQKAKKRYNIIAEKIEILGGVK